MPREEAVMKDLMGSNKDGQVQDASSSTQQWQPGILKAAIPVPNSIGHDSQDKPDGSPLVQGSMNRSQDKDSRARDGASSSFETAGPTYEDGQYSLGNEEKAKKKGK